MSLLKFNPATVPRNLTRAEWKAADRWRRIVARKLEIEISKRIDYVGVFGLCILRFDIETGQYEHIANEDFTI